MAGVQVRGQKRPADDHLENAQRLSKRLNALSLGKLRVFYGSA